MVFSIPTYRKPPDLTQILLICEVHDQHQCFQQKLSPPTSYMTYLPTYLPIYQSLINQSINLSTYLSLSLSIYVYSWISIYIYIHICAHTWGLQLLYCSYVGPFQIHVHLPGLIEAEHKTAKHSSEDGISWYILFCFYVTGGEIIIAWHA